MKPHHSVLVSCYLVNVLFIGTAMPICLTWNTSNTHLTVKCSVPSASHDISIVDPAGKVHTQSVLQEQQRFIYDVDKLENSTTHPFTTVKDMAEGEWKCRHRNEEKASQVSFTKGIGPLIDIDISAENMKIDEGNRFILACFSCWVPHTKGVDIFVNNVLEDSIRYVDGQCYHKLNECSPKICTCSAGGRNFTWAYISDLSNITFTCAMRFKDEVKAMFVHQKADLTFNGTVFIKHSSTSDKESDDDNINSGKGGTYSGLIGYWILGIFCLIISGIL
ncbi:uncharacterized protein [Mytilus edulis]|uniref:uncharacterized protein n=1 Tax=Mytilus edulis TaxID=6550 RepID=UPI0039F0128E